MKLFEKPWLEIIKLDSNNIVATSITNDIDAGGSTEENGDDE